MTLPAGVAFSRGAGAGARSVTAELMRARRPRRTRPRAACWLSAASCVKAL